MGKTALNYLLTQEYAKEKSKDQRYDQVWSDFMNTYGENGSGLTSLLNTRDGMLADAFGKYKTSLDGTTSTYTGALSDLAAKLNSDDSKVTFGLEGFDPLKVTTRQARADTSTQADIARNIYGANLLPTSEEYNYNTNKANSTLDKYKALQSLAQSMQGGNTMGVVNAYSGGQAGNGQMGALGTIGALSSLIGNTGQSAGGIAQLLKAMGVGGTAAGITDAGVASALAGGAGLTGAGTAALWAGADAAIPAIAAGAGDALAAAAPTLLALV